MRWGQGGVWCWARTNFPGPTPSAGRPASRPSRPGASYAGAPCSAAAVAAAVAAQCGRGNEGIRCTGGKRAVTGVDWRGHPAHRHQQTATQKTATNNHPETLDTAAALARGRQQRPGRPAGGPQLPGRGRKLWVRNIVPRELRPPLHSWHAAQLGATGPVKHSRTGAKPVWVAWGMLIADDTDSPQESSAWAPPERRHNRLRRNRSPPPSAQPSRQHRHRTG